MAAERVLVNFFYAQQVGHAVEALHHCHGHHAADPAREVSVLLNAATAVRFADFCPWLTAAYPVHHPLLEPCLDSARRLAGVPREWDWVLDDNRRFQPDQLALFPGLRDLYSASDRHLRAAKGRAGVYSTPPGYVRHRQLRFQLPSAARATAAQRFGAGPRIAVMLAGSADRALYPSLASWRLILDALAAEHPGLQVALVGRLARDERSSTALGRDELAALLAHPTQPLDLFDADLDAQLAVVEACDVFIAPHTGFGMAALAVGTPWLALSGGRWFEFYFNRVPFRSVIPDTRRYPAFSQFDPLAVVDDGDGPRTPSMSGARIREDLDRIVAAASELISGSLEYETALEDYFRDLVAAHGGDTRAIWSLDGVHLDYVG